MVPEKNGHWTVLDRKQVYASPWMKAYEDDVIDVSGVSTTYSYADFRDGVSILALTEDDEVYLVERFRYATRTRGLELVSGGGNKNEVPDTIAKRELAEELGLCARTWINVGAIFPFPDKLVQTESLYIARDLYKTKERPPLDTSEELNVLLKPFEQVVEWAMDGTINHGPNCVLILKAAVLRSRGEL